MCTYSVAILIKQLIFSLYLQAENLSTWERILERWGWPTAFLIFIITALYFIVRAIWKAVWPLITKHFTDLHKNLEEAQALIRQKIKDDAVRSEAKDQEFTATIDKQRESHERILMEQARMNAETNTKHALILEDISKVVKQVAEDCSEIKKAIK